MPPTCLAVPVLAAEAETGVLDAPDALTQASPFAPLAQEPQVPASVPVEAGLDVTAGIPESLSAASPFLQQQLPHLLVAAEKGSGPDLEKGS